MHYIINLHEIMEVYGMMIPLSILLIDNDEKREFAITFYMTYKRFMFYLVKQRVANLHDAEDIVADVVIRLIAKTDVLKAMNEAATRSYIASTVRNTAINYVRKNGRHYQNRINLNDERFESIAAQTEYEDLDDYLFNRYRVDELLEGFHQLSQIDRDLLMLRHYDNLTIDDIAQVMNMSCKNVSSRLYKAKQRVIAKAKIKKSNSVIERD